MMSALLYGNIDVGLIRKSRLYPISEAEIIEFASQWNPESFHIDKEYAKQHAVGGLFASGVHILAICVKLANEYEPQVKFVAGLGWDDIRFHRPVFPGDHVRLEHTFLEKRLSNSQSDKGIVKVAMQLFNQVDNLVVSYSVTAMVEC